MGRCSECGQFGTLIEEAEQPSTPAPASSLGGATSRGSVAATVPLKAALAQKRARLSTGVPEFDRVLSGGLVAGSLTLLSGHPGVGKSTLLLQSAALMAQDGATVLYACGEESPEQVALRAERLGLIKAPLEFLPETDIDIIAATAQQQKPTVLIVDSIQTAYTTQLTGAPGGVGQVRACTNVLMHLAKECGITVIVVGHVTKDGSIAGPRVLEHMVDTVLQFEGDRDDLFRIIRALKHRFGATDEIGIFEMTDRGLLAVASPSEALIEKHDTPVSGSVYFATCEGSRPLVVEVQALVNRSYLPNPRRLANGIDTMRLLQVIAVLERRAGVSFADLDVLVSVVGGVRVTEPAVDAALALALLSARSDKPLPTGSIAFGEISLTGDIRRAPKEADRLKEAQQLGIENAYTKKRIGTIAQAASLFK